MSRENIQRRAQIISEIEDERTRQFYVEGHSTDHDDEHDAWQLALAGAAYACHCATSVKGDDATMFDGAHLWPFDPESFKPKDPRRNLIRAAALILAEIERIDRATERTNG